MTRVSVGNGNDSGQIIYSLEDAPSNDIRIIGEDGSVLIKEDFTPADDATIYLTENAVIDVEEFPNDERIVAVAPDVAKEPLKVLVVGGTPGWGPITSSGRSASRALRTLAMQLAMPLILATAKDVEDNMHRRGGNRPNVEDLLSRVQLCEPPDIIPRAQKYSPIHGHKRSWDGTETASRNRDTKPWPYTDEYKRKLRRDAKKARKATKRKNRK